MTMTHMNIRMSIGSDGIGKVFIIIGNGNWCLQIGTDSELSENQSGPFPIIGFPTDIWTRSVSSPSILHVQGCSAPQIFSKQQMSPFEMSSCCSCHVFSYYFAQFLLLERVKCPPFLFSQPNQLNLVPRSSRLRVH